MPDFEWHVMDGTSQKAAPAPQRPAGPQRRLWRAIQIVGLILALAAATVLIVINRRAEEAIAEIKKDVLASHALVRRAAAQADQELLDTVLAETPGWRTSQHQLLERRLISGREPFGLTMQDAAPEVSEVILSPDLTEAEVVFEQAYTIAGGYGVTETVRLQHTAFYHFDRQRWLLSPPGDDFWGRSTNSAGTMLTLVHPERDREVARRLAPDLDMTLSEICAELGDPVCPADMRLQIKMETVASSLIQMLDSEPPRIGFIDSRSTIAISLPSPTLVGIPMDEPGYQALRRLYAARLVKLIAQNSAFAIQSQSRNFLERYYQVLNKVMIEQELRSWPLTAPGDTQSPPPIPLPDQDIALYCIEDMRRGGDLYRYTLATGTWLEESSDRVFTSMTQLPHGKGVVLTEQSIVNDETTMRLVLWRNGKEQVLLTAPTGSTPVYFSGHTDPAGRKLVVSLSIDSNRFNPVLLDLEDCASSGCSWDALPGTPVWSPDGRRTLVTAWREGTLLLGNGAAQPLKEIGPGFSPFWIDNATYGYVALDRFGPRSEIVAATITHNEAYTLLNIEHLLKSSPGPEGPFGLWISPSSSGQASGSLLLMTLSKGQGSEYREHVFLVNPRSGEIVQLPFEARFASSSFSPDGRWLAGETVGPESGWLLYLYDIEQQQAEMFTYDSVYTAEAPRFTWSADGQWLLVLHDGVLHLIAPGQNYQRTIVPDSPGCMFADWVNRQ